MKLKIAVQMDPIARINIRGDSTFAMLLEAQKRGHAISYYTPDQLAQVVIDVTAPAGEGENDYLCTFPGHWTVMHGKLVVAKDVEGYLKAHPVK